MGWAGSSRCAVDLWGTGVLPLLLLLTIVTADVITFQLDKHMREMDARCTPCDLLVTLSGYYVVIGPPPGQQAGTTLLVGALLNGQEVALKPLDGKPLDLGLVAGEGAHVLAGVFKYQGQYWPEVLCSCELEFDSSQPEVDVESEPILPRTHLFPTLQDLDQGRSLAADMEESLVAVVEQDPWVYDSFFLTYNTSLDSKFIEEQNLVVSFFVDQKAVGHRTKAHDRFIIPDLSPGEHLLSAMIRGGDGRTWGFFERGVFAPEKKEHCAPITSLNNATSLWRADEILAPRNSKLDPVTPPFAQDPTRVAVCVSGQLRTFFDCGGDENLIDAVIRGIGHKHVDVFFEVSDACWNYSKQKTARRCRSMSETYLKLQIFPNVASFTLGDPVYVLFDTHAEEPRSAHWHRRCGVGTFPGSTAQTSLYPQFLQREGCLRQIAAHEVGLGFKYDWVIVTRTDVQFQRAFPVMSEWANLDKEVVFRPFVPYSDYVPDPALGMDQWAVMGRGLATVYLSCSGYLFRCHNPSEMSRGCNPIFHPGFISGEMALARCLADHGVRQEYFPIPGDQWTLVRPSSDLCLKHKQ